MLLWLMVKGEVGIVNDELNEEGEDDEDEGADKLEEEEEEEWMGADEERGADIALLGGVEEGVVEVEE